MIEAHAEGEVGRVVTAGVVDLPGETMLTIILSVLIGCVTFTGSFVAYAKLQGLIGGSPVTYFGQKTNLAYTAEPGKVLLFPGYLRHMVITWSIRVCCRSIFLSRVLRRSPSVYMPSTRPSFFEKINFM